MGQLLKGILNSFSNMKARILMLGLDGAGKTTILYKMKINETLNTAPTIGFNVETINYKNLEFTVWDIGGQYTLRALWHHYYQGSDAIIYVLDSSDLERINEAKETLEAVINNEELKNVPVLVFANKMDVSPLKPKEIVEKLGLHKMRREWQLQPCCGLNGEGLVEGFEWLNKETKKAKK